MSKPEPKMIPVDLEESVYEYFRLLADFGETINDTIKRTTIEDHEPMNELVVVNVPKPKAAKTKSSITFPTERTHCLRGKGKVVFENGTVHVGEGDAKVSITLPRRKTATVARNCRHRLFDAMAKKNYTKGQATNVWSMIREKGHAIIKPKGLPAE